MKRNDINGILLVNKKSGHSSQKMLTKIKKRFNVKIGHTGTLDPLASGLMVVLVGNSCTLSSLLIKEDKEYICKMKFGILTSTLDLEGSVIKKENFKLSIYSENDIKEILNKVIGEKDEIPPIYSAIKYNGKKLYEYARDNKISEKEKEEILNIKKRKRNIYDIEVLEIYYLNNEIIFKVKCSSGTYIRSLVLEIA